MKNTQKKAIEIIEKYGVDKVYVNPRGEFFIEDYLAQNSLKKGEKLMVFNSGDKADEKVISVVDLIEFISNSEDKKKLEEIAYNDKRVTVKRAVESRLLELSEENLEKE